jgi:predicted nucleic acid-binding protein
MARANLGRKTRCMARPVFVDTNVFLYARELADLGKQMRATELIETLQRAQLLRINLQVINEFCAFILCKQPKTHLPDLKQAALDLSRFGQSAIDMEIVAHGWSIRERFNFQWLDTLLLASAHRMQCCALLTEDMTHGEIIDGVEIIDPFRIAPATFLKMNN